MDSPRDLKKIIVKNSVHVDGPSVVNELSCHVTFTSSNIHERHFVFFLSFCYTLVNVGEVEGRMEEVSTSSSNQFQLSFIQLFKRHMLELGRRRDTSGQSLFIFISHQPLTLF